jgi:transcriptional regulator with XRE-family HTH domain
MNVTRIRRARLVAGLTQFEVAMPLGITVVRLSQMEREEAPLTPDMEERILLAIQRLSEFDETVARKKKALIADVGNAAAR